jgi:hypothetical protein
VTTLDGTPVVGHEIRWAYCEWRNWAVVKGSATTDSNGSTQISIPTAGLLRMIGISASVEAQSGDYRRRFGDTATVRISM